ncbi:MAG: hypothetical protein WC902_10455 [Bacteroidales bacterium]|jgi:hypothetical protein
MSMAPPEISVAREHGQYCDGLEGLSIKLSHDGEELNEIFVYDQDIPVFLANLYRALTQEQRMLLAQIKDAEEVT